MPTFYCFLFVFTGICIYAYRKPITENSYYWNRFELCVSSHKKQDQLMFNWYVLHMIRKKRNQILNFSIKCFSTKSEKLIQVDRYIAINLKLNKRVTNEPTLKYKLFQLLNSSFKSHMSDNLGKLRFHCSRSGPIVHQY